MKNFINSLVVLTFLSLTGMEQNSCRRLTTYDKSTFFKIIQTRDSREKKLCYHDRERAESFYFPAGFLEVADCKVCDDGAVYLRLIYKKKIECWALEKGKKKFSQVKMIPAISEVHHYVALSDNNQFVVAQTCVEGSCMLAVYKESCWISTCAIGDFTIKFNDESILFNAINTLYAVRLANWDGSRWIVVELATGKILSVIWTSKKINFIKDDLIDDGDGNLHYPYK